MADDIKKIDALSAELFALEPPPQGHCSDAGCGYFPMYGVAPHECYWRKPGGFDANPLGTSTVLALDDWPDNFLAEIEPDRPVAEQLSWGLCGVHYCPNCKHGMAESNGLWGPQRIRAALDEPQSPRSSESASVTPTEPAAR